MLAAIAMALHTLTLNTVEITNFINRCFKMLCDITNKLSISKLHHGNCYYSDKQLSNHRADFDEIDVDDAMLGEVDFQLDEESPERDLGRQSLGAETVQELAPKIASRKRGSSRPDFAHRTKRSQTSSSHHSHYLHAQEDAPGSTALLSKYHKVYEHPLPNPPYPGESRTPSRGNHPLGGYYQAYSPHSGLYSERRQRHSVASHLPYEADAKSPPSPPRSPGAGAPSISANTSTPEELLESFRSPTRDSSWFGLESKSTIGLRPSPFQRSPGITSSFGMETPTAMLMEDCENLGPIFTSFYGHGSFDAGTPTNNLEETSSPTAVGRDQQQRSPLAGHIGDLSSIDQPILHGNNLPYPNHEFDQQIPSAERYRPESHADGSRSAGQRKYPKPSAVTTSGGRGYASSRLDPGAQPKQLWPSSSDSSPKDRTSSKGGTPGPVRLKIGGAGSLTTRNTFEGINNMMHQRASSNHKSSVERTNVTSGYMNTPGRPQAPAQQHRPLHHSYDMTDISTPKKPYNQMRSSHGRNYYPYPPFAGSGRKPIYPSKAESHYSMPPKPMYTGLAPSREGNTASKYNPSIAPPDGKENGKKKGTSKRSPCNCKKSRCLKLYCECFAAKLFCQGCNCTDCGNTPENAEEREKAIKDTRAKNSKAFQNRFTVDDSQEAKATQKVHNMGCKCKKSACLKKYCECFNAGALCGTKCKCSDCLNYAGSQALIDKRRKIKDRSGAEYALRVSDEQWKSTCASSGRKALPHRRHPTPSPMMMPPHHTVYPSPRGHPPQRSHGYSYLPPPQRSYYTGPHAHMMPHGHPHAGYVPRGMAVTPGYHRPAHRMAPGEGPPHSMYHPPHSNRVPSAGKPSARSTTKGNPKSTSGSPKRKEFDPATSREKRRSSNGESEPTEAYFGENIKQPKTTALAVFSFLSNSDLYHASLVCRRWGQLAFDEELWGEELRKL